MRFLFCFVGGPGHFEPMVPIARAARAAGHTVAVACGPSRVAAVAAAGFTAFAIGSPSRQRPFTRLPLLAVDVAREEQAMRERFASHAARLRCRGVLALAASWRPDVIVADEADFGSLMAAEVLAVPYAVVLVLAAGSLIRAEVVAAPLDQVRREYGLAPDPDLAAPGRYLVLTPFPPSLRDPSFPLPATAHSFRAVDVRVPERAPPPWIPQRDRPLVYFTLGTEFNVESGDLFERVLAGLHDVPADVLVTVGHQIDPDELGPQPGHVRVERYIPQTEILPYCDLVVFHGGSGTLTAVAACGLPMVLLAMGADQPANAERCQALGVGISLDPVRVTPAELHDSVLAVSAQPAYRQAAQRLRAEMSAQPEVSTTVELLERLAVQRSPIRRPEI